MGEIRPILLTLLGGAALLLLIAGTNVASLLLVRSESRKREIAVRTALGASRSRVLRQFVAESLVLVAAGSLLGLMLAGWAIRFLTTLIPADMLAGMPFLQDLAFNGRTLAFAALVAALSAATFSFVPALQLRFSGVREGLSEGSRGSAGTAWRRMGSRLVILELATAVVLLVGAGLLLKSLYRLLHLDLGFQAEQVATLQLAAPRIYASNGRGAALEGELISAMGSLPGVTSAAVASDLPATYWGSFTTLKIAGMPLDGSHNDVPMRPVSSRYFSTLRAKLLRGRYFTEAEDVSKPHVAIINRTFAGKYFPSEDSIGKQLTYGPSGQTISIVGVVDDLKEGPLDAANRPILYIPFEHAVGYYFNVVVRTPQPAQALPSMIAAIRQIDRNIVTKVPATMTDVIGSSQTAYMHRSSAWIIGGFAAMALLLSAVGLYGTVSYSVSQRDREIGVRMALGADQGAVYRLILSEAGRLIAMGTVAGIACSLAAATLIRKLLFGVESWDVSTLVAVTALLGASAFLASYIPARRAASLNPVETLRAE